MTNKSKCAIPPDGWSCTRKQGHKGPCAALPTKPPESYILVIDDPYEPTTPEQQEAMKKFYESIPLPANARRGVISIDRPGEDLAKALHKGVPLDERHIMQFFIPNPNLPPNLRSIAELFHWAAKLLDEGADDGAAISDVITDVGYVVGHFPPNPELAVALGKLKYAQSCHYVSVALRLLLEAKDAAVRARMIAPKEWSFPWVPGVNLSAISGDCIELRTAKYRRGERHKARLEDSGVTSSEQ